MQETIYTPEQLATDAVIAALHRCQIPVHKATPEMVDSIIGFHQLQIVAKEFDEQLEDYAQKQHSGLLYLGKPMGILQASGITTEMTIPPYVLNFKLKQHGLDIQDLKGLALAIQNPIMVYKDDSAHPCFVVISELERKGGKMSIAIEIDESGEVKRLGNVSSIHQKTVEHEDIRLRRYSISEFQTMLKYVDKAKVLDWFGTAGLARLMHPDNPELPDYAKVINQHVNPKIEKQYFQFDDLQSYNWLENAKTLYGWTVNGEIYLTEAGLRPETPIHEYTHLWANAMRLTNPEGWMAIKGLLRNDPAWVQVVNNPAYADIKEDEDKLVSEILAHNSGKENAVLMISKAKEVLDDGMTDRNGNIHALFEKIRIAMAVLWKWVSGNIFQQKEFHSKRQIYDCIISDLVSGIPLPIEKDKQPDIQFQIEDIQPRFTINLPPDLPEPEIEGMVDEAATRKIEEAVQPYKHQWMDNAREEHTIYYNNIRKRADYARERCAELDTQLADLYALNIGEEVTPEIRRIEALRRPYAAVSNALPTRFDDVSQYLDHIIPKVEEDWRQMLSNLSVRCGAKELDAERMVVRCMVANKNKLTLAFTERGKVGMDATLSMSKATSIQRIPHIRCTFTEHKPERKQDLTQEESSERIPKQFKDRLAAAFSQVEEEVLALYKDVHTRYYATLWEKLPYSRQRYAELQTEIATLNRFNNPRAKALLKVKDTFGNLVNSEAAKHETVDSYLGYVRDKWPEQNAHLFESIGEKAQKAGLDTASAKIREINMREQGIELTLTDANGNALKMQMNIAKGIGPQRPPQVSIRTGELMQQGRNLSDKPVNSRHLTLRTTGQDQAKETKDIPVGLITKAKVVEYNEKLYVTCHIAGVRQSPVRIRPEEWQKYRSQPGSDKTALAAAHYPKEIARAISQLHLPSEMSETQQNTLKR